MSRRFAGWSLPRLKLSAQALNQTMKRMDQSPKVQEQMHAELNELLDEIRCREQNGEQ